MARLVNEVDAANLDGSGGFLIVPSKKTRLHPIAAVPSLGTALRGELSAEELAAGYSQGYRDLAVLARQTQASVWVGPEGVHIGSTPEFVGWDATTKRLAFTQPTAYSDALKRVFSSWESMYNGDAGRVAELGRELSLLIFGEERTPLEAERVLDLAGGGYSNETNVWRWAAGYPTPIGANNLRVIVEVSPIGQDNPYHRRGIYWFTFVKAADEAPGIKSWVIMPNAWSPLAYGTGGGVQPPKGAWPQLVWSPCGGVVSQALGPVLATAQGKPYTESSLNHENYCAIGGFSAAAGAGVNTLLNVRRHFVGLRFVDTEYNPLGLPGGLQLGAVKMFKAFVIGMPPGALGLSYIGPTTVSGGVISVDASAAVVDWLGVTMASLYPGISVDDNAKLAKLRTRSVIYADGQAVVPAAPLLLTKAYEVATEADESIEGKTFIEADGTNPSITFGQASSAASGQPMPVYHVIRGVDADETVIYRLGLTGNAGSGYVCTAYDLTDAAVAATNEEQFRAFRAGVSVTNSVIDGASTATVLTAVFGMQPAEYNAIVSWDAVGDDFVEARVFAPGVWDYTQLPERQRAAVGMVYHSPKRTPFTSFALGVMAYGRFLVKKLVKNAFTTT